MKQYLLALEQDTVPGARSVLGQLDLELIATIERAARTDWLPIETNYAATELLTRELGVARSEAFFRLLYRGLLEGPLLESLLRGIRALGVRSPLAYLKHTPRAYSAVFRGVGRPELSARSEHHVELEFFELPAVCLSPALPWVRYTAAIYALSFDLSGCPGSYEVTHTDPARGHARVRFEW